MTRRTKKPSNVLPVPKAFAGLAKRRYITRTGPMMQPLDVCLRMALSLRHHGTAEAVRTLARKLVDQVCAEQKPRLKELARRPTNEWERQRNPNVLLNGVPDELVIPTAIKMVERYCYLAGLRPDEPFEWVDPAALADGRLLLAERTGYIEQRDRAMEYRLLDRIDGNLIPTGGTFVGRCRWTYP